MIEKLIEAVAEAARSRALWDCGRIVATSGEIEAAERLALDNLRAHIHFNYVKPNNILTDALERAHACATLKDDGTCDGCYVSEALRLSESATPIKGE